MEVAKLGVLILAVHGAQWLLLYSLLKLHLTRGDLGAKTTGANGIPTKAQRQPDIPRFRNDFRAVKAHQCHTADGDSSSGVRTR